MHISSPSGGFQEGGLEAWQLLQVRAGDLHNSGPLSLDLNGGFTETAFVPLRLLLIVAPHSLSFALIKFLVLLSHGCIFDIGVMHLVLVALIVLVVSATSASTKPVVGLVSLPPSLLESGPLVGLRFHDLVFLHNFESVLGILIKQIGVLGGLDLLWDGLDGSLGLLGTDQEAGDVANLANALALVVRLEEFAVVVVPDLAGVGPKASLVD